jgi:Flp pilus assembly protein TadG
MKKSFFANASGASAIMFAIGAVPIVMAVGAATDILRMNDTQTLLQGATDAAALAGANFSSSAVDSAKVKQSVHDYLVANGALDILKTVGKLESGFDKSKSKFFVRLNGKIDTTFMSIAGYKTLNVGGYSEVAVGSQAIEIALVLDNTASMSSEGRLIALKSSAKDFVNTVLDNKPPGGYVKIGIVPFADYVNVGMGNRKASWMNVPPDTTTVQKNVCNVTYPNATSSNCHDEQGTYSNDGVPTPYTYQVCNWNMGAPVTVCADQTWDNKWYGCVGSRNSPLDTGISQPATKYPGILNTTCPNPITLLTDVKSNLINQIDSMVAVGETYIPSGLVWGWNLLDSQEPLTVAKSAAAMQAINGVKSLVLMTDGDNTKSPDYPYHWGNDPVLADKITAQLCDNLKADGINVYTVAFKVSKQSSKDLLNECASSSDQAFDASNDAGLKAAFANIASSLSAVRLTK